MAVPKHAYTIVLCLFGDRLVRREWVPVFVQMAKDLEHFFHLPYRDIRIGLRGGHSKTYICMKRNEQKIRAMLARRPRTVSFTAQGKQDHINDVDYFVDLSEPRPAAGDFYYRFYFEAAPCVLEKALGPRRPEQFFLDLICRVNSDLFDVRYGVVHPLDTRKMPLIYFSAGGSPYLTVLDAARHAVWRAYSRHYKSLVWWVAWGNAITRQHLGEAGDELLQEVAQLVGQERLVEWHPGKYFFTLPMDVLALPRSILTFPDAEEAFENQCREAEKIFARYGRLMPRAELDAVDIACRQREREQWLEQDRQRLLEAGES